MSELKAQLKVEKEKMPKGKGKCGQGRGKGKSPVSTEVEALEARLTKAEGDVIKGCLTEAIIDQLQVCFFIACIVVQ